MVYLENLCLDALIFLFNYCLYSNFTQKMCNCAIKKFVYYWAVSLKYVWQNLKCMMRLAHTFSILKYE